MIKIRQFFRRCVLLFCCISMNAIANTSNAGLPWETASEKFLRIVESVVPPTFLIIAFIFLFFAVYVESSVAKIRCSIACVVLLIVAISVKIFL